MRTVVLYFLVFLTKYLKGASREKCFDHYFHAIMRPFKYQNLGKFVKNNF